MRKHCGVFVMYLTLDNRYFCRTVRGSTQSVGPIADVIILHHRSIDMEDWHKMLILLDFLFFAFGLVGVIGHRKDVETEVFAAFFCMMLLPIPIEGYAWMREKEDVRVKQREARLESAIKPEDLDSYKKQHPEPPSDSSRYSSGGGIRPILIPRRIR
jgi:hypothetical protein